MKEEFPNYKDDPVLLANPLYQYMHRADDKGINPDDAAHRRKLDQFLMSLKDHGDPFPLDKSQLRFVGDPSSEGGIIPDPAQATAAADDGTAAMPQSMN